MTNHKEQAENLTNTETIVEIEILKEKGKTIREIAEILNISKSKVGRIVGQENGTSINLGQDTNKSGTKEEIIGQEEHKHNPNWKRGERLLKKHYTKEELELNPKSPYNSNEI